MISILLNTLYIYISNSLLVAHQADVSRKLNQAFLLVDSLNNNFFVVEERSNIYTELPRLTGSHGHFNRCAYELWISCFI